MLKPFLDTLRITKPRHLARALLSPGHALKMFKYHSRRVPEREFCLFFAEKWGCDHHALEDAYRGLELNEPIWNGIRDRLKSYPGQYGLQMTRELPALYILLRLARPEIVVETGVSSGASSTYILSALKDNGRGKLCSIDLPPDNLPPGRGSGWIVPDSLRDMWLLRTGDSKDLLKPLLDEIGTIDCFIHDSLHTYEHMMWEFSMAWRHLRPGGLFLSHDVGANESFMDFMKIQSIPWTSFRVYHVLGGFRKEPL